MIKKMLLAIIFTYVGAVQAVEIGPYIGFEMETGGETLVATNLGDVDTGAGFHLNGGIYLHGYHPKLATLFTIGRKWDEVTDDFDQEVSLKRTIIEISQYVYIAPNFRVGAGYSMHRSIRFKCEIFGVCAGTAPFDDANGFLLRLDYFFAGAGVSKGWHIGVKHTSIKYPLGGVDIDANSLGLSMGVIF